MAMTSKQKPARTPRLSREKFLENSLPVILREGGEQLRIDWLVAKLGVTKGSFYWHFTGREDFVCSLLDYWDAKMNRSAGRIVTESDSEDPIENLRRLMLAVFENDFDRGDITFRAWAAHDPLVAKLVRKVDRYRFGVVTSLFEALGFTGSELEIRVRVCLTFMSLEGAVGTTLTKAQRIAQLDDRVRFLTRP
jgi:AcrR family transcriptional regulator